jgi:excisionase family DNA binding protein
VEISEEMSRLDDLFADYPPHLTVTQVSEVLGIGRATTYTWLNAGTIPAYRVGSAWVILRDELKDAIASGRNLPPPGEPAPPPLSSEDDEQ